MSDPFNSGLIPGYYAEDEELGIPPPKRKKPRLGTLSTRSDVRSPTSTRTEVRSPTRTEVRSPTRTATEAYTQGNFTATVTGGAGAGATSVTIRAPENWKRMNVDAKSAEDQELGFVDAAVKVAGGIGKVFKKIGTAVKKKKAKTVAKKAAKKGKIIQMDATDIVGQIPKGTPTAVAAKAAQKIKQAALGADDIRAIVRELVAGVPAQTRAIVLEAIKEASAAKLKTADQIDSVAGQVDASLRPEVTAMLAALQTQQLQGQATYEHQTLVAEQDFRKGTQSGLSALSARLDQIEAGQNQIVSTLKLPGIAIVRKRMPIFGPKNVLEG